MFSSSLDSKCRTGLKHLRTSSLAAGFVRKVIHPSLILDEFQNSGGLTGRRPAVEEISAKVVIVFPSPGASPRTPPRRAPKGTWRLPDFSIWCIARRLASWWGYNPARLWSLKATEFPFAMASSFWLTFCDEEDSSPCLKRPGNPGYGTV